MTDKQVYRGDIRKDATSSDKLKVRLTHNLKYGSADFNGWFLNHLGAEMGMHVLDVGCGTGAQALQVAELVGKAGSVSALDISEDSVRTLMKKDSMGNIQTIACDMQELDRATSDFRKDAFDIVYSVYAIYYADDPEAVMQKMIELTKPGGRVAIFVPDLPHSMVEIVAKCSTVPRLVLNSLRFGREVAEPLMRKSLAKVETHSFTNLIRLPDVKSFLDLWRATTYYNSAKEGEVAATVKAQIDAKGEFALQKNGYMIIASVPG